MKNTTRHHLFAIPFHALLLAGLLPSAAALAEEKSETASPPPTLAPRTANAENAAKNIPQAPAFLGVETVPVDVTTGQNLQLAVGTGLRVRAVAPDSPAWELLLPDDVLVLLDQQILCNPEQLRVLIRARKAGDDVTLEIRRDGDPLRVTVKLGTLPAGLRDPRPLREQLPPLREYFGDLERQLRERGGVIITDADGLAEIAGNLPDEIKEHLRELEKDLRQHRGRLQDKADKGYNDIKKNVQPRIENFQKKLRERLEQKGATKQKSANGENGAPAENNATPVIGSVSTSIVTDGDGTACLTMRNGCRCLKVQDSSGKVLFDGPVDTPEQRNALAPEVAKKLETVEQLTSPAPAPATPPASPASKPESEPPASEHNCQL